jgi:hypothetical protein
MSDQVIERKPNGQFAKGVSGNLGGNAQRTRHIFNKTFLEALAADFRKGGPEAIAKVRKYQPAAYMKICALLVPRELKLEHSGGVKAMSDEQLEAGIEAIKAMLEQRAGQSAKLIEGRAEPAALPAPEAQSPEAALKASPEPKPNRNPNRLMMEAAVGPREHKPRKVPSPART